MLQFQFAGGLAQLVEVATAELHVDRRAAGAGRGVERKERTPRSGPSASRSHWPRTGVDIPLLTDDQSHLHPRLVSNRRAPCIVSITSRPCVLLPEAFVHGPGRVLDAQGVVVRGLPGVPWGMSRVMR
jgi:hypothetical protein